MICRQRATSVLPILPTKHGVLRQNANKDQSIQGLIENWESMRKHIPANSQLLQCPEQAWILKILRNRD